MDEKVRAHAQLALIPDIWPLSQLPARTEREKKKFSLMIYCRQGGLWWAGLGVEGDEMRVVKEQRTFRGGMVSLVEPRLKIFRERLLFLGGSLKLTALT